MIRKTTHASSAFRHTAGGATPGTGGRRPPPTALLTHCSTLYCRALAVTSPSSPLPPQELESRGGHGSHPGLDRGLDKRVVEARVEGWQRPAGPLALLDALRVHGSQPKHGDGDLLVGSAVPAEVLASHDGLGRQRPLRPQPAFVHAAQPPNEGGIVVERRRGVVRG